MNLARVAAIALLLHLTAQARAQSAAGVRVEHDEQRIVVFWPLNEKSSEQGRLVIDRRPGKPLIESLGIGSEIIVKDVDPVTFVTVGSRVNPPDRPPGMSVFNVFFDSPAKRPYQQHRAALDRKTRRIELTATHATVAIGKLTAGPFTGELQITVHQGSRLVHVEAVVRTEEDDRAFLYDAGLAAASPSWTRLAWLDTEGNLQREEARSDAPDHAQAVRHRTIVAESDAGSIACFPPPHQYFFPRDYTDNQKTVWSGRNHRGLDDRPGFGVRQTETGGGNFVPWFNAPPGTIQRLGVFYLISKGKADKTLAEVLKYTRNDRFPTLPGRVTFTSHWHMAVTLAAMKQIAEGQGRTTPDLVKMFKDMNVNLVHLAEFHGDGHPRKPGPLRLPELKAMFAECQRLSDDAITFLPGEEANAPLSVHGAGKETGHWLYLFPKPVYWTMVRARDQPFREDDPSYGPVYHVGNPTDMVHLLEAEHGLGWTAHPRIKGSNFTPDAYRDEAFYRSDVWLGGAWKAMPADLSSPRLGQRVLDLFDDMANWGQKKYVPGEVDVFKIDHTHELYGHMNINYLQLDRAPRYEGDWTPVLDALRRGRFFVTTGEVLLKEFSAGGQPSGATLKLPADGRVQVTFSLDWTFPMNFAEVISGDGRQVYRDRIDLTTTHAFDQATLNFSLHMKGRKWVRVEAWDIAANGTFSQPVWIEPED